MYLVRRNRGTSNKEFFQATGWMDSQQLEIVDLFSSPRVCFAAAKNLQGITQALIIPHSWIPGEWHNYRYFFHQEDAHLRLPIYYQCPQRILDQLSPAEEIFQDGDIGRAIRWREKALAWNQERSNKTMPRRGQWVRFDRAILLDRGESLDPVCEFVYLGGNRFGEAEGSKWFWKIQDWRDRDFQVLEDQESKGSALGKLFGSDSTG